MGREFTGGGFEELRRVTEKAFTTATRYRDVTEQAIVSTEEDTKARKALADRARTASSRSIAEAETLVQRGAAAAERATMPAASEVGAARIAMDRLAISSDKALRPIAQMRQWGPYAFSKSQQAAESLAASMQRIGLIGTQALPGGAGPRQPIGLLPPAGGTGPGRYPFGAGQPGILPPPGAPGADPMRGLGIAPGFTRTAKDPAQIYKEMGVAASRTAPQITRVASAQAVLNAQMERHGALSSEFLQQLARGNVTLRQFGNNLVTTAGKFGGWLAAGAGLFALIGILGAVGGGAIDASTGVNQLRRVLTSVDEDKAQKGFRDLATEFNVPIDQAAAAQYEMAKIFNDQNQSLEAARVVLAATKVGELDLATASRYLTSITQGFNLEASQMSDVFGQIDLLQNRFGVNIQDTTAGMAKAAGAARTLGGHTETVGAFFAAARRGAGVTGDVTGTAVQRMTTFLQQNKDKLREFGIDVDKMGLDEIFNKAFKIAPTLDRQELIKLAQGLGGHFYGPRVFLPALRQGDVFDKAQRELKGAGEEVWQKELATTLDNASEVLAKIGVQLGVLGANLAASGFLDLLLLGVKALGDMMVLVNGLLGLFNDLPKGLRHTLVIMAELYALFRLMRKFNIGSTLPGAAGQAFTNPRNAANDARAAATVRQSELSDELVSASRAVTRAELERTIAMEEQRKLGIQQASSAEKQLAPAQAQEAARKQLLAADENIARARIREGVIMRQMNAAAREQSLRERPLQSGTYGIPFQPSGERTPGSRFRPTPGVYGIPFQRSMGSLGQNIDQFGYAAGTLQTGTDRIRAAAAAARARVARSNVSFAAARARIAGAAAGFRAMAAGMVAMISPLDVLFLAVGVAAIAVSQARAKAQELSHISTSLSDPQSVQDIDSSYQQIVDQIEGETVLDDLTGLFNQNRERQEQLLNLYNQQRGHIEDIKQAVERTAQPGRVQAGDAAALREGTFPEVYADIATNIRKRLDQGKINQQEADRMVKTVIRSLWQSKYVDDPRALAEQVRSQATTSAASESADIAKLKAELEATKGPLYDPVADARSAVTVARASLTALKREGGDPKEILQAEIDLRKAQRDLEKAVDDHAKAMLDARGALALSRLNPENTVGRARQSAENARNTVELLKQQNRPQEEILTAQAAVNDAEAAAAQAVRERIVEMIDIAARLYEANAPLYAPLISEKSALLKATRTLSALRAHGGTQQQIADAFATVQEAERALALAANDRVQHILELQGQIAVAGIDPEHTVQIARREATNAHQLYALALSQGRDQEAVLQAYLAMVQADAALNQAIEQRAEDTAHAMFDLRTARAEARGNDVQAAIIAYQQAVYDLRHADTAQERISARAAKVRAAASRRDAAAQARIDDIEFSADIGRITVEQEIAAYERLLSTMKLSRDMRRDIRRKIHDLKQQTDADSGGFELGVGDIRLPTIYDIRRAVQGGINSNPTLHDNSKTENTFIFNGTDTNEVARRVKGIVNGSNRSARNSAGVRG